MRPAPRRGSCRPRLVRPRAPEHNTVDLRLHEVTQLRAARAAPTRPVVNGSGRPSLSAADHTVLIAWSEALDQARGIDRATADAAIANARAGAPWRAGFDLPEPSGALSDALDELADSSPEDRELEPGSARGHVCEVR